MHGSQQNLHRLALGDGSGRHPNDTIVEASHEHQRIVVRQHIEAIELIQTAPGSFAERSGYGSVDAHAVVSSQASSLATTALAYALSLMAGRLPYLSRALRKFLG